MTVSTVAGTGQIPAVSLLPGREQHRSRPSSVPGRCPASAVGMNEPGVWSENNNNHNQVLTHSLFVTNERRWGLLLCLFYRKEMEAWEQLIISHGAWVRAQTVTHHPILPLRARDPPFLEAWLLASFVTSGT